MSFDPISAISDLVKTGMDKIFPDANEKQRSQLTEFLDTLSNQTKIIVTEMSGNWLQKSWRPILMLSIVAIVVNNYIIYPYLSLFTSKTLILELPQDLYALMKIGVGGYIVGRSGEKIAGVFKK